MEVANQPFSGEEIVPVGNTGEDIKQVGNAGEDIKQGEDAADTGEQTGQVEDAADAGEQTGQVEGAQNAGEAQAGQEQAGQAQAGEAQAGQAQPGQAQAGEAQAGQAGDAGDNNDLKCVNISTASGVCSVYLIGVTHHTQDSCNSVRSAIQNIKPEVVFLELCDSRLKLIVGESLPDTTWKDAVWCIISGQFFINIVMWFLSKMVADIDAEESEFKVAYEEAKMLNSEVIAGDIPIGVTYERIWKTTSLKQKSIIVRNYRKVYAGDVQEMNNLYDACSSLYKILVEDRDKYMTLSLRDLSNKKWSSILAVVGKDHVEGIHNKLSDNIEINGDELYEDIIRSTKLSPVNNIVVSVGIVGILVACYFWKKI